MVHSYSKKANKPLEEWRSADFDKGTCLWHVAKCKTQVTKQSIKCDFTF